MLCLAQAFVKSTQNNMNLDAASGRPSAVVCAVGHTGSIRRPSPAGDRRLTLDHIIPSARPTKLPPSSMNTACNHSKSHTKCVSAYSSCCCPEDRRLSPAPCAPCAAACPRSQSGQPRWQVGQTEWQRPTAPPAVRQRCATMATCRQSTSIRSHRTAAAAMTHL